jgi:hypothetical protein
VFVHRASLLAQASAMARSVTISVSPRAVEYAPLLAMAERVRDRMRAAALAPADLLDVHDFISFTLRAAAVKAIAAAR